MAIPSLLAVYLLLLFLPRAAAQPTELLAGAPSPYPVPSSPELQLLSPAVPADGHNDDQLHFMAPILSRLGFHDLSMAAAAVAGSFPALSAWSGPITLFAPSDAALAACGHSCSRAHLLTDHLVPGLLPSPALAALPFGSKLSSVSPGRCLTVTSTSAHPHRHAGVSKLFVDGAEIIHPDLYNDGRLVVHGLDGFVAPLSPFSCLQTHPFQSASSASAVDVPSGAVRFMLRDAIVRLSFVGYGVAGLGMRIRFPELERLSNLTLFALDDAAVFAGGHSGYVGDMAFHVVPNHLLTHADLLRLPQGKLLPTLAPGRHLMVTRGPSALGAGISINYVPFKAADLILNSRVAVHGILAPFPRLFLASDAAAWSTPTTTAPPAATSSNQTCDGTGSAIGECISSEPSPPPPLAAAAAAAAPQAPVHAALGWDMIDDGL